MRDRSKRFYSSLICTECGLVMTIPRPRSQKRKEGHIKTMYCAVCKDKRDFIENNYKALIKGGENENTKSDISNFCNVISNYGGKR